MSKNNKVDYGIDAPGLVQFFLFAGVAAGLLFFCVSVFEFGYQWVAQVFFGIIALYLLGMGSLMVYWSKIVKLQQREITLDEIHWRGDERVLDVGCGGGLMLIGAAKRLTSGRAIGVDIWQQQDQSSNSPDVAKINARLEGVLDKIDVQTADMRALPFDDKCFDIVVSHWVVHNLDQETERNKALFEMVRVLKSGGKLILSDIENRDAYLRHLSELGLVDCRIIFNPALDVFLGFVSFGSFRPTTIIAYRPEQR